MNKEYFNTNIISSRVFYCSLCDLENILKADLLNCRSAFVVHREHLPKPSNSDYIENKTTLGGLTLIKSMIENFIIKSFNQFMLCLLSNIRPNVIFNNATKFNQDTELTRKA